MLTLTAKARKTHWLLSKLHWKRNKYQLRSKPIHLSQQAVCAINNPKTMTKMQAGDSLLCLQTRMFHHLWWGGRGDFSSLWAAGSTAVPSQIPASSFITFICLLSFKVVHVALPSPLYPPHNLVRCNRLGWKIVAGPSWQIHLHGLHWLCRLTCQKCLLCFHWQFNCRIHT